MYEGADGFQDIPVALRQTLRSVKVSIDEDNASRYPGINMCKDSSAGNKDGRAPK
jgi:hypothetical protein